MVKTIIKVTNGGCGIKYTDDKGVERHALKTPEDGPFECEIEQAKRLVNLKVAEFVPGVGVPINEEKAQDGELVGHLDAAQLEAMDYNKLKKLAADMGVEPTGKKKADYIAAIVAAEVELGDEDEDDGDELPDLDAADPE